MYTGRLIEDLIKTVERYEHGASCAQPVLVKMAKPRVDVGRIQMQAFFYQMHAAGLIQAGMA